MGTNTLSNLYKYTIGNDYNLRAIHSITLLFCPCVKLAKLSPKVTMASVQQANGVNQLSKKEKDAIDEAVKEAANNLKNAKPSQEQLVVVTGVMKNLQDGGITSKLAKTHEWKGHFLNGPPKDLGETGAFVHEGAFQQGHLPVIVGSKAAVIYQQIIAVGFRPLAWLLAWNKPAQSINGINQVYVEAGYLDRLEKIEWSEIEKNLDASSNVSHYWDSETGAAAAARIEGNNGDRVALVGATFDRINGLPPQ